MSPEAASWWAKEFPSGTGPAASPLGGLDGDHKLRGQKPELQREPRGKLPVVATQQARYATLVSTKFLCRTRGFVPTGDGMSDRKALGFDSISIAASAHSRYAYSNTEHPLRDTTPQRKRGTVAATGTATARRQKRSEAVKAQTVTQTDRATPTATAWRRLRRAVIRSVKQAAEHWRRPDAKTCVR
jgi:hypothetical protein